VASGTPLIVVDYVGQTAAEAAQALRRAGLRPALERSFGWEPKLCGQVVAQDPTAGSEVARNTLVTLYVAAPEAGHDQQPTHEHPPDPVETVVPADESPVETQGQDTRARRRRRKPGMAERQAYSFDAPPPPAPPTVSHPPAVVDRQQIEGPITREAEYTPAVEDSDEPAFRSDELEQLVSQVDAMFAGEVPIAWRRVYPTRHQLVHANHHGRRWSR
jgi:hypothetical protein